MLLACYTPPLNWPDSPYLYPERYIRRFFALQHISREYKPVHFLGDSLYPTMASSYRFLHETVIQDFYNASEGYITLNFDWGSYEGSVIAGLGHGFGIEQYRQTNVVGGFPKDEVARYRGDFKNGKRDGYGRLEVPWEDNTVYEGGWINGKASGFGKVIKLKGGWAKDWEECGFKEGLRHGWGVACITSAQNESVFLTGGFKEGERHGYYVQSSGTVEWFISVRLGRYHGHQHQKQNGAIIARDFFLDGRKSARPTSVFNNAWIPTMISFSPSRARFHDRTHGIHATVTSLTGDNFVGNLSFGLPHGFGTMFRSPGHTRPGSYDGGWKHGYACGFGIWRGNDGTVYEGGWLDGKPHGYGKFIQGSNTVEIFWEEGRGYYFETTLMATTYYQRESSPQSGPLPAAWSM
jgi:hypothetical protein